MLKRVDHIDMRVNDLDEAVVFFEAVGFIVQRRTDSPRRSVEVALPGKDQVVFELRQADDGNIGIQHIAFQSSSPQDVEVLQGKGMQFSVIRKTVKETGRQVSNFTGFDNTKWQLVANADLKSQTPAAEE